MIEQAVSPLDMRPSVMAHLPVLLAILARIVEAAPSSETAPKVLYARTMEQDQDVVKKAVQKKREYQIKVRRAWREAGSAWDRAGIPFHMRVDRAPFDSDLNQISRMYIATSRESLAVRDELGLVTEHDWLLTHIANMVLPSIAHRVSSKSPVGLGLSADGLNEADVAKVVADNRAVAPSSADSTRRVSLRPLTS